MNEIRPSKENTLYLPIKQVFFNQITEGTKNKEYRDISPNTYKKYLEIDESGYPLYDTTLAKADDPLLGDIMIWNNGVYPYIPKNSILYLNICVGYAKERDSAIVEVEDITFEPVTDKDGNPGRFFITDEGEFITDANGDSCFWMIVFHIGKIIEIHKTPKATKVNVTLFYHKAVTPKKETISMSQEEFEAFVLSDKREQIEIVCKITNSNMSSYMRDIKWEIA